MDDMGALLSLPKEIASAVGDILGSFAMGSAAPRVEKLLAPVESLVEGFAKRIKEILNPFQKLTDLATHFVSDFDPALVADLSHRFRDLNAVIGVALRPIVDIARDVVKALGDYLLPQMKKLEPIVRELAGAVGDALIDGAKELGDTLDTLMPLFRELKDFVVGIIPMLGDLRQLLAAIRLPFMQLMKDLIHAVTGGEGGGGIKGIMDQLRRGFQQLIVAIVQFMAQVFVLVGWMKGLEALKKSLKPIAPDKADSTGTAVALNPVFKSIGDLGKSIQAAMFAASDVPGGRRQGIERSNELLEGIEGAIKMGEQQGKENKKWFDEKVKEVRTTIEGLPDQIAIRAKDLLAQGKDLLSDAVKDAAGFAIGAVKKELNFQANRMEIIIRKEIGNILNPK